MKAVSEDDREMLEILEEFLADTYVKDQAVICEENIDQAKVNRVMDEFWDRAAENMNSVKKTSDLMGSLRMNLSKKSTKLYRFSAIMYLLCRLPLTAAMMQLWLSIKRSEHRYCTIWMK